MPVGDGKTIPPTGNAFRLIMCTVGHWNNGTMEDGRWTMDEQYPF
jgi:hypothetical protein